MTDAQFNNKIKISYRLMCAADDAHFQIELFCLRQQLSDIVRIKRKEENEKYGK